MLAAGFEAVAVGLLLHMKPQILFSSTSIACEKHRFVGLSQAGSVKVLEK